MILNLEMTEAKKPKINTRTHSRVRVFLIDSYPIYREGLTQCLNNTSELEIVGVAAAIEEMPGLSRHEVDVIILDMDQSDPRVSWDTLQRVTKSTDSAVLPLSFQERDIDLVAAYSLHCAGWLLRSLDPPRLIRSIQYAPKGTTFSPLQIRRVLTWKNTFGSLWMNLRDRELEILWLVLEGKNNPTIAHEVSISEHTVEKYISILLQRFEKPSRTALIAFCFQNNLHTLRYFPPETIPLVVAP